jgi:hypothetical protein
MARFMYSIEAHNFKSSQNSLNSTPNRERALKIARMQSKIFPEVRVYKANNRGQSIRQVVCYINGKEKVYDR